MKIKIQRHWLPTEANAVLACLITTCIAARADWFRNTIADNTSLGYYCQSSASAYSTFNCPYTREGSINGTGAYMGVVDGSNPYGNIIKAGPQDYFPTPPTVIADEKRHQPHPRGYHIPCVQCRAGETINLTHTGNNRQLRNTYRVGFKLETIESIKKQLNKKIKDLG